MPGNRHQPLGRAPAKGLREAPASRSPIGQPARRHDLLSAERQLVLEVGRAYLGTWYSWGGDDPAGFDCSGLVVELYQTAGWLPRDSDYTAEGLRKHFRQVLGRDQLQPADLVFWMARGQAIHVGVVWQPTTHYLAAEGGHQRILTPQDARRANAFIKVRPIQSRGTELARRYASPQPT